MLFNHSLAWGWDKYSALRVSYYCRSVIIIMSDSSVRKYHFANGIFLQKEEKELHSHLLRPKVMATSRFILMLYLSDFYKLQNFEAVYWKWGSKLGFLVAFLHTASYKSVYISVALIDWWNLKRKEKIKYFFLVDSKETMRNLMSAFTKKKKTNWFVSIIANLKSRVLS